MPSLKTITPILGGSYYHIFNRGINRQPVFFQPKNYDYFLRLLDRFLSGYVHFLAYCLLPNHFHFVIKVKEKILVLGKDSISKKKMESLITDEEEIGKIVSNQFRSLFITYSMAINKQENRSGSLFDKNFKRLEITNQDYLEYAIFYAHYNPEKHGLTDDYKLYRYSSFKAINGAGKTNIAREFVLELFGGKDEFVNYHSVLHEEREAVILE